MLDLVAALREVHGPLLFLLDYQAQALYRLGHYDEALDLIERRQRRSSSVTTQMREAQVLLAAGHQPHARSVAPELGSAYARNSGAVTVAATRPRRSDANDPLNPIRYYENTELHTSLIEEHNQATSDCGSSLLSVAGRAGHNRRA
jgi:hypothetical protein